MNLDTKKIKIIKLPHHFEDNGDLTVMESNKNIPFEIKRVFVVRAPKNSVRGQHAHKKCVQLLTCPNGKIDVECNDGVNKYYFTLENPNQALIVPSGIWAQQRYFTDDSLLVVLCDRLYEPEDYIRDYSEFLKFVNNT